MRRSLHFLLFAVRDSWAGRPSYRNASSLPPSRMCLSCGSELTIGGFFFPLRSNLLLFTPPFPSISVSSQRLVLLLCLSFSAWFLLPSKLKGLSQMSCLSLHWARLSFQTFAGGFAVLTCSFAHLWIPAAWMCVCVFVFETMYMLKKGVVKEIRALSYMLTVEFCSSMPRKWGIWRTVTTPAWLYEN